MPRRLVFCYVNSWLCFDLIYSFVSLNVTIILLLEFRVIVVSIQQTLIINGVTDNVKQGSN